MLFYMNDGFPGVSGCIDCTPIGIRSPGDQFAELYRNRKGLYVSQCSAMIVVSDPNLQILYIVTRWPAVLTTRVFATTAGR
ncbi:hypothetical protein PR048_008810 [Dryococelus australis]|uniref:Uncharacterized protein n=1 Tax=Dryococelus australis TaxID=614101 RepID=A0ABQ9HYZ9_9NEOP|nr:hypothetical protein PR048_008810 [Dryococelus australis]